ncbi:HNH endonuclease [Robiginitomaculum antarcticum]|uniref:HNH endonuclease n=1 Tax=Robiginitomaculum antarcticum TaxID=437507 RepID=UPI0003A68D04|nr:HNH endonuclease [Robiginitomaculum antarcticum]
MGTFPWKHNYCIICLESKELSSEHIIPKSLGGVLTCRCVCENCNNHMGHQFENEAKNSDPVRIAISNLAEALPNLYESINRNSEYSTTIDGQDFSQIYRNSGIFSAKRLNDGSLLVDEAETKNILTQHLKKDGLSKAEIAKALDLVSNAPFEHIVDISNQYSIKKRQNIHSTPKLTGKPLPKNLILKIVYEFACARFGERVIEASPQFNLIRTFLLGGKDQFCSSNIKQFDGLVSLPFHGIAFEGNTPFATFQIRLFGSIAYKVFIPNLEILTVKTVYTHNLLDNSEHIISD